MKPLHRLGLASGLLTGLVAPSGYIVSGDTPAWFAPAIAQPQTEEEKKRQQQKQNPPPQRQQPPPQQKAPPPPPPQQRANPNPPQRPPSPPPQQRANQAPQQQPPPQFKRPPPPPNQPPPVMKQVTPPPNQPPPPTRQVTPPPPNLPPPAVKQALPPPANPGTPPPGTPGAPNSPRFMPKTPPSAGTPPGAPGTPPTAGPTGPGQPRFLPKGVPPGSPPGTPPQGFTKGPGTPPPGFVPKRLDDVKENRQQRVEGNRTVIREPGNRTIIKQDNRIIIRHDETDRFRFGARDVRTIRAPGGLTETYFLRPDGARVVTLTDPSGRVLRRYRRDRSGREINIIDNRRFYRNVAIGVGAGLLGAAIILNLPRPVISIPRERYIVDYDRASDDDLYEALIAPPVMPLERAYSLDEIRDNYPLRERMRSVDLDNITFDSGSFEVTPDQYSQLERIARVINRVLERRPDEVFMIEGHTDATGTAEDNLSLSDRRAQAVAQVLSESFGVPPENLVTQGYGEQYLKIDTPGPERANRRVTVRPVGALMGKELSSQQ